MYEPFRTAAGSGRFRSPPRADAVVCTLPAGILIAHQIVNSRRKFRFQCTLISVLCTVFSFLNTFQKRVISSSEIIFELKDDFGGGDHTLLESVEKGEDSAKNAYESALETKLPAGIHDLVRNQYASGKSAHDRVRTRRGSE